MNLFERIKRAWLTRSEPGRPLTEDELEDQRATEARTHEVGLVFQHPVPADEPPGVDPPDPSSKF